jgi:allophanate hydrolase subunit 2
MSGPLLRFNCDAVVAVTGAVIPLTLNGESVPMNTALLIPAGATLSLGTIAGAGARSYLCLRGGCRCRITWAAKAPSPSASSAAMAVAPCGRVMCCMCQR